MSRDTPDISDIKERLDLGVFLRERYGTEFKKNSARCLFAERHKNGDAKPSLLLSNDRRAVKCLAGDHLEGWADCFKIVQLKEHCSFPDAKNICLQFAGLAHSGNSSTEKVAITYDYCDESGELLFQVVRYRPKTFRQRRPDGQGGWLWSLTGVRRVLFHLADVTKASSVLIVEGEKDVETAYRIGLPEGWAATCNPMGAGKWLDDYSEVLCGKHVAILPDADEPGEHHGDQIMQSLSSKGITCVRLQLSPEYKDLSEWVESHSPSDFCALLMLDGSTQKYQAISSSDEVVTRCDLWPTLASEALHGLAGDIVQLLDPHTEADPVAVLLQFLIGFGNSIGRTAHFLAESDVHYMNLFTVLVGETSKGRKGSSWSQVRRVLTRSASEWAGTRVLSGLSSGEGLIWAVRDEITKSEAIKKNGRCTGEYETVIVDPGIDDKRLLVLETEFASAIKVMNREGNTLSAMVRQAWDLGDLRAMTKNSPAKATGAHISIIGHITRDELLRQLDTTEAANGFCNRFLWICVKRSKCLPEGGQVLDSDFDLIVELVRKAIEFGKHATLITRDEEAREMWFAVYPTLSEGKPGLLGSVISRAEAQVMRLACLYALIDLSYVVKGCHLEAALATWQYCEQSATYIFGERLGDPVADELMTALRTHSQGLSRTDIRDLFDRNRKTIEIDRALGVLARQGLARKEVQKTATRPVERWFAVQRSTLTTITTYTTN